jgi:hypothetical protein
MDLATRDADAMFAELICADAQWLREEFDALGDGGRNYRAAGGSGPRPAPQPGDRRP